MLTQDRMDEPYLLQAGHYPQCQNKCQSNEWNILFLEKPYDNGRTLLCVKRFFCAKWNWNLVMVEMLAPNSAPRMAVVWHAIVWAWERYFSDKDNESCKHRQLRAAQIYIYVYILLSVMDMVCHYLLLQYINIMVYQHMPILRPHAARPCVREPKGNRCKRRGGGSVLANSSDFGLLWKQSSAKCEIPCLGRWRTAVQNLMPLALSSAEKFITVRTNTHIKNSNRYVHTLPIGMCGYVNNHYHSLEQKANS